MILLAALILVPLNNRKLPAVENRLHDEPRDRLAVFGVDLRCFDEFRFELGDACWVGFGAEVDGYCVHHFEGWGSWVS